VGARHFLAVRETLKTDEGGVKVTEARRHAATAISRAAIYATRARHSAKAAERLVDLPRDEIALLIELVVHLGMN
jgi:hypothetical protein